jgi:hypothetical protein
MRLPLIQLCELPGKVNNCSSQWENPKKSWQQTHFGLMQQKVDPLVVQWKPTLQTDNLFELVQLVDAQLQPEAGLVFALPHPKNTHTHISYE